MSEHTNEHKARLQYLAEDKSDPWDLNTAAIRWVLSRLETAEAIQNDLLEACKRLCESIDKANPLHRTPAQGVALDYGKAAIDMATLADPQLRSLR